MNKMAQKIKEQRIDTSTIWYGIPAEGILDLLGVSHGNLEDGTNIVGMRQELLSNQLIIVFEMNDKKEMAIAAGGSDIVTPDEIFKYFFDFKNLIEWTGDYFDRVIKNRKVISNLKAALDTGRRIRSCDRFQRQTELPIDEHFSLVIDYPRMPAERFFWIIGGKEKVKDIGTEYEVKEYITSDEKKISLSTPLMISAMPKYYYDPSSNYPLTHYPAVKINNIKVNDEDILHRLLKEKEIHSTFFRDNFLSGNAFNNFVTSIAVKLKRVIYATFPDCFFSEEIRHSSLLDLYFQSWTSMTSENSVMSFNPDSRKQSIEYYITEKMESEKNRIFKDGVNGSNWLSTTSLETLIQDFTHSVKGDSN